MPCSQEKDSRYADDQDVEQQRLRSSISVEECRASLRGDESEKAEDCDRDIRQAGGSIDKFAKSSRRAPKTRHV